MREEHSAMPAASSRGDDAAREQNLTHEALRRRLNDLFRTARPRLARVARARGVPRDDIDDTVQETLVTAWRQVEHLRSPERVDAWLDGICAHVSQHQARRAQAHAHRLVRLTWPSGGSSEDDGAAPEPLDVTSFDLHERLHQQDLETLLDRALGYISESSRALIELCYLRDLPQREVADQIGLTLGALELRLHRTRRDLRRILSTTLRADALAFGLAVDDAQPAGWRETREWCNFCGRHRLQGTFESLGDGRINFRLRCPACSPRFGGDVYSTGGMVPLGGTRTFRPALKRLIVYLKRHYAQDYSDALQRGWHACPSCRHPAPVRLVEPGHGLNAFPSQWCLVFTCPTCGRIISPAAFATYWGRPEVAPVALQFIEAHPRWIMEPDVVTPYAGQSAIQFRLTDVTGGAQLTIFSNARTLQVLDLTSGYPRSSLR
jgi:RNA polymerase sigma factor (sigma-70 family)